MNEAEIRRMIRGGIWIAALLFSAAGLRAQPVILTQPANQRVRVGAAATFSVTATGRGVVSYQWQFNGSNLPNHTVVSRVAGNGDFGFGGDGGPATNATLNSPAGLVLDATGNLYIADYANNRVRRVDTNGSITTIAGNGSPGCSGDGAAAADASLHYPAGLALDATGNLYIADSGNSRIRKVDANGIISTVAGNGNPEYSGDGGAATSAGLWYAAGVAVDTTGNLYIADTQNNRIRKVGLDGVITSVATNAVLSGPESVAADAAGNLYIADARSGRVLKAGADGGVTVVSEGLSWPMAVALDSSGNLFVANFMGDAVVGLDRNGLAWSSIGVSVPAGVAVDSSGSVYIAGNGPGADAIVKAGLHGQPTLTLTGVSFTNVGAYTVVVTDDSGSITSSVAALTLDIRRVPNAADWPRFRGPDLAGISPESILLSWPADGLPVVWQYPMPGNYSSPALSGGILYTLMNTPASWPTQELCVALDALSGTQVWATPLGRMAAYSTPTVKDGRVYVYSGSCVLYCLDAVTGATLWRRDLVAEFGGRPDPYGNSQSPWVEDGRVFVSIASTTNCLKAFDANTGELLWQGQTDAMTYASPVGATIHGVRQIIFTGPSALVSVTPDTGQLLWRYPRVRAIEQGSSPVVQDDIVISTSEQEIDAVGVVYFNGQFLPTPLWVHDAPGYSLYATTVVQGQQVYSFCGGSLQCLDLASGATNWQASPAGYNGGSVIMVDNKLLMLGQNGQLILAEASPLKYQELGRTPARPKAAFLNSPAFWNGLIFARSLNELVCFEASPPARLQLRPTPLSSPARLWLGLGCSDGSLISTNRAAQIGLLYSGDLRQPLSQWTPVSTPPVYTNGACGWEVPILNGGPPRFYSVVEP